jgi:hypothetical protein
VEASVLKFFERYEESFNRSLRGDADMDQVATLYASEFIALLRRAWRPGKTTISSNR